MPNFIGSLLNCFLLSLLPCVLCYLANLICHTIHSLQIQVSYFKVHCNTDTTFHKIRNYLSLHYIKLGVGIA
jgi:hypothetical protein